MQNHKNMESLFPQWEESNKSESNSATRQWMDVEVCFCNSEFAKAFDTLENESKNRIAAYVKNRFSSAKAALELGLSESNFGKRIGEIKRRLGAKTLGKLFANYKKQDVKVATSVELMQLLESQTYRCAVSGVELTPKNAELDHKLPVSKGGTHTIENLQWLHRNVNRAKGSMRQEEFIEMCRRVTAWNR